MNLRLFMVLALLLCATLISSASDTNAGTNVTTASTRTLLRQLVVAREHTRGSENAKSTARVDADHDGCDTRHEVLIAEAITTPRIGPRCALRRGRWLSRYDGVVTTDPSSLVVDHLVPLAEAWQSGAWRWSPRTWIRYANDLAYGPSLIAVSARSSRSRASREPQGWLPTRKSFDCTYLAWWVAVKWRWRLTINSTEKTFLSTELAVCAWPSVRKPDRPLTSTRLCGHFERLNVHGLFLKQYQLRNTFYRADRPMCIENTGGLANFRVIRPPRSDPAGRVSAFPDVFRGCIWNRCSPDARIPIRISAVGHLMSTWHTRQSAPGTWNAAYELWLGKRRMVDGQADGAELMIWLNEHGQCCPLHGAAPKVRIDARPFRVTHWRACSRKWQVCFNYIQFRLIHRTWRLDRVQLKPFITRAVRMGLIRPRWWIENVEAGFEIWSGGRGLATTRFGVRMTR